LEEVFEA